LTRMQIAEAAAKLGTNRARRLGLPVNARGQVI